MPHPLSPRLSGIISTRFTALGARRLLFFVVLSSIGAALDYAALEVLPGSYFSFAMAPVLAVAARLGPLPGLLALVLAKSSVPYKMGNPYVVVCLAAEILLLGLWRRKRPTASLVAAAGLFWPLFGVPFLAAEFLGRLGYSWEVAALSLLKIWLSGLADAYLGGLLADSRRTSEFLGEERRTTAPLSRFMLERLGILVVPSALFTLFFTARVYSSMVESGVEERVRAGLELALARLAEAEGDMDEGKLIALLNSYSIDAEGWYEPALPGDRKGGTIIHSPAGICRWVPSEETHPLERWRNTLFMGAARGEDFGVRFIVPFEDGFLQIYRIHSVTLWLCLLLLYSTYALQALIARSLSRKAVQLSRAANNLPDLLGHPETPALPVSSIEEFDLLSVEFRSMFDRLNALFRQLKRAQDRLEQDVALRTVELADRSEQLWRLTLRMDADREEERTRVARELHDEFGQSIAAISLNLGMLEREPRMAGDVRARRVVEIQSLVEELSESMRRIVTDLRPAVLDRLGLPEALSQLAVSRAASSQLDIRFDSSLPDRMIIEERLRTAAYRVAQEAVSNAVRHSGSLWISIFLRREGDSLVLEVEDGGCGLGPESADGDGGCFGILGMRERCAALGGHLDMRAAEGLGTVVTATFPLAAG